jgi:hypothetical protein
LEDFAQFYDLHKEIQRIPRSHRMERMHQDHFRPARFYRINDRDRETFKRTRGFGRRPADAVQRASEGLDTAARLREWHYADKYGAIFIRLSKIADFFN